jgi:PDZ domain/Aspartyl protease
MKRFVCFFLTIVCLPAFLLANAQQVQNVEATARTEQTAGPRQAATIPFELVNKNIYLQVKVAQSRPLWFVLDTGDKYAGIDLAIAKTLGLDLGDKIPVSGGGKDVVFAYFTKNSSFSIAGLEGFSQPLFMAVPFGELSKVSGREFAGILGSDFISQFVVEIDYLKKTVTLHDKAGYQYHGDGESLPITFNAAGHPQVRAQVIEPGRPPIDGTFVIDLGSGATLMLNKPFVDEEHFLQPGRPTIPWMEGLGFGGGITGSVGRIKGIKIGGFFIDNPVTIFTQASSGPFASAEAAGNIGAAILEKFTIILDYERNRIILEPNSQFPEPLEYNRSGLDLVSLEPDYKVFKISTIADNSPASESGLKPGDILVTINGHPATRYTLSEIRQMIQDAKECHFTVERGNERLRVNLKPRRLI